jgi:hypothetical protein
MRDAFSKRVMRRAAASIAGALVVLVAGCGGSSPSSHSQTKTRNVIPMHVLDRSTARRLLGWASRLRICYRERELAPGRVTVSPRRLTIAVDPTVPPSVLTGEMLACASTLGKPPARASFHSRRGRTVIVLPTGYALSGTRHG